MEDKHKKIEDAANFLKQIASHPDIIPGIHNYCDRWCERCPLANRCTVFHMENRMRNFETGSEQPESTWDDVSTMLSVAAKLLNEQIEEMGIDVDELDSMAKNVEHKLKNNPKEAKAVKLANEYSSNLAEWIKLNRDKVLEKHLLLDDIKSPQSGSFTDAFEVINYYMILVSSKTYRAFLHSADDDLSDDSRGSAKVALIIIDRSMASWVKVFDIIPELEDNVLQFLALLSKIKKEILCRFPNAMEFVRPGFDEL
jgi:hypothetical protein